MTEITARLSTALADRYKIERHLGEGGMATVYLAEDLKHKRKVAVKVLRPELAAVLGAERFVREITTTANLQHPHILPLFDSGEADSFLYYVMPFIDGETLRDKLNREKQLGIDEAVKLTTDVADALHYAHGEGVIHRDIKPENILIHNGRPMVADFGIALAVSAASGGRMTETGLSLGTPHYMSPEQATGDRELDARSDVYSIGAVVYEMLAGDPPHTGSTAQAIVAKVLTERPAPLGQTRDFLPGNVDAAVQRALAKTPADRFGSAGEFAAALVDPTFTLPTPARPREAIAYTDPWKRLSAVLAGVAAVLLATTTWGLLRSTPSTPAIYDVALPDSARMEMNYFPGFAVSPVGDFLVYVAERNEVTQLWYRSLVDDVVRPIAGSDGATNPTISPDGDRVAFYSGGELKILSVQGGPASSVAEVKVPADAIGPRWVSESRLLIPDRDARVVRWIDPQTGDETVTEIEQCHLPYPIPNDRLLCSPSGEHFANTRNLADGSSTWLQIGASVATASIAALLRGSDFRLIDGEYLVYMSLAGELRATRWNPSSKTVRRPVTLVSGVRRELYAGVGQWDVSGNGTLVYALGANADLGRLVRSRGAGPPVALPIEPAAFQRLALSPDGRRLAVVLQGFGEQELQIYNLEGGAPQSWLREFLIGVPLWTPDGDSLIVSLIRPDTSATVIGSPTTTSLPDTLMRKEFRPRTHYAADMIVGDLKGGRSVAVDRTVMPARIDTLLSGDTQFSVLSPDGAWLVYQPLGGTDLVLTPYPSRNQHHQVTTNGFQPQWLSATEIVFYRCCWEWYRSRIDGSQDPPVSEPILWFEDPRLADVGGQAYTVTQDGSVIYKQTPLQPPAAFLRVVPHWVEQMKRALDEANQ